jgi:hypothetical protein
MKNLLDRLAFLTGETVLGTLIAVLSVLIALSSYNSAIAGSEQTKHNMLSSQAMTEASSDYLTANQMIVYDYTMYDGWFTAEDDEKAEYYQFNFSDELQAAIAADENNPFSEAYYDAMYAEPNKLFDEAYDLFVLAEEFSTRGDLMQLTALLAALGLAFAAWASLVAREGNMRLLFSLMAIIMLVVSIISYLMVPVVVGIPL